MIWKTSLKDFFALDKSVLELDMDLNYIIIFDLILN